MNNKARIYLDDIRTPISPNNEWVEGIEEWTVVRNYEEFVAKVVELGLSNIELISLDHDLGDTAMNEYFKNVSPNYQLNYDNIEEKTGFDCCKWLINYFYDINPNRVNMSRLDKKQYPIKFPGVMVHSANPIGSANMMGYINNFLMNEGQPQTCVRVNIEHTV
jgi:hypothetical protein